MVYRCQQMDNVGQRPRLRRNASLQPLVNGVCPLACEDSLRFVCYSMLVLTWYLVAAILQSTIKLGTVSLVTAMAWDVNHTMMSAGLRTASSVVGREVLAVAVLACKIEAFQCQPTG